MGTEAQVMHCQMSIIIKCNYNLLKSNHQTSAVASALGDEFPDEIKYCVKSIDVCICVICVVGKSINCLPTCVF